MKAKSKKTFRRLKVFIVRKYQNFIRLEYIRMRRGTNFIKEVHEIRVKKGKLKYYLWIVETHDNRLLRFNIGRHFERDCEVQELILIK